MISGTLKATGTAVPVSSGRMNGSEISFTVGQRTYKGRVTGNRMEGTTSDGGKWRATRV
jgi:hypothetical protein